MFTIELHLDLMILRLPTKKKQSRTENFSDQGRIMS